MQALAERYITEDEYQALEERSEIKHEYFRGRIYAMSGGSNYHALLGMNAGAALVSRLRGSSCRVVNSDQRVKIEATGLQTYPDVSVYCAPARFEGRNNEALLNPVALIEVLSPSTETYDRTDKFDHYKQLPSLRDYLLVAQERVRVEHYHRGGDSDEWLVRVFVSRDDEILLASLNVTLPLRELYDGVDVPSGPQPLRPPPETGDA